MNVPRVGRRGLPLLLAGLGLFAYLAISPKAPSDRHVTYRFPAPASSGQLEVRWTDSAGEQVRAARFEVEAGQRQSSHRVLLADGDYRLEVELPGGASKNRHVHVDADTFVVVLDDLPKAGVE